MVMLCLSIYFTTHVTKKQNKIRKKYILQSDEEALGETIGFVE